MDKIKSKINNQLQKYENEIKDETPNILKSKLNEILYDKSKELWEYYRVYLDEFKSIFNQET